MTLTWFADHPLAQPRAWRLVGLAVSGIPVAFAGMIGLGLLAGAPLLVLAGDVLRARSEAALWAAGLSLAGFPLSLVVAAADREWCRLLVDRAVARRWVRRRWTWRRLTRVPVNAVTWRLLLWLLLRVLIGWSPHSPVGMAHGPWRRS